MFHTFDPALWGSITIVWIVMLHKYNRLCERKRMRDERVADALVVILNATASLIFHQYLFCVATFLQ